MREYAVTVIEKILANDNQLDWANPTSYAGADSSIHLVKELTRHDSSNTATDAIDDILLNGAFRKSSHGLALCHRAKPLWHLAQHYTKQGHDHSAQLCAALAVRQAIQHNRRQRADFYQALHYLQSSTNDQHLLNELHAIEQAAQSAAAMPDRLGAEYKAATDEQLAADLEQRIARAQIVAKVVSTKKNGKDLNFLFQQLAHPVENRPRRKVSRKPLRYSDGSIRTNPRGKPLYAGQRDRRRRFHPRLNEMQYRYVAPQRPANGNTILTYEATPNPLQDRTVPLKKTSTTLLLPNGVTPFYNRAKNATVILFDLNACDLKEQRYLFLQNALSNRRGYLDDDVEYRNWGKTLAELKHHLRTEAARNRHTELLIAPTKNSVIGVLAPHNTWQDNIIAQYTAAKLKQDTGIDVPAFTTPPYSQPKILRDRIKMTTQQLAHALSESNTILLKALLQQSDIADQPRNSPVKKRIATAILSELHNPNTEQLDAFLERDIGIDFSAPIFGSDDRIIHRAIEFKPQYMETLLRYGADANAGTNRHQESALTSALRLNRLNSAKLLLQYGATITTAYELNQLLKNARALGLTPAQIIAKADSRSESIRTELARTLPHAFSSNHSALINALEPLYSQINMNQFTATDHQNYSIHIAIANHPERLAALLQHGANPNLATTSTPPLTPLQLAVRHSRWHCANLLLRHGASIRNQLEAKSLLTHKDDLGMSLSALLTRDPNNNLLAHLLTVAQLPETKRSIKACLQRLTPTAPLNVANLATLATKFHRTQFIKMLLTNDQLSAEQRSAFKLHCLKTASLNNNPQQFANILTIAADTVSVDADELDGLQLTMVIKPDRAWRNIAQQLRQQHSSHSNNPITSHRIVNTQHLGQDRFLQEAASVNTDMRKRLIKELNEYHTLRKKNPRQFNHGLQCWGCTRSEKMGAARALIDLLEEKPNSLFLKSNLNKREQRNYNRYMHALSQGSGRLWQHIDRTLPGFILSGHTTRQKVDNLIRALRHDHEQHRRYLGNTATIN